MKNPSLSFEQIRPHLLYQFKSESELLKAVEEVGKLFNFYRENIDSYKNDKKLVSAYCAYFLTTNYPKLFEVLKLLGPNFSLESFDEIIDVGTGPGTFLLALGELVQAMPKAPKLRGVDASETMLEQASRLFAGLRPNLEANLGRSTPPAQGQSGKRLLLFTHSLNEMGAKAAIDYVEAVEPAAILLVEPGTKECFEQVLKLRSWAMERGFSAAYPCFSNAPCPLNLEEDWCHQFIQVEHALDVERMTQKLRRNRRLLPMIAHLYQKEEPSRADSRARLIRVKRPTKHSLEWQLCEGTSSGNRAFNAEIPKRGMSKKEVGELEDVLAGAELSYSLERELEGKSRIRLDKLKV